MPLRTKFDQPAAEQSSSTPSNSSFSRKKKSYSYPKYKKPEDNTAEGEGSDSQERTKTTKKPYGTYGSSRGGYRSYGKAATAKTDSDEGAVDQSGEDIDKKDRPTRTPRDPKAIMFGSAARMASSKDWPAQALQDRLVEKFSDWPDAAELASITVERLVAMKAVDDVRFARGFIRQRATRKSVKTLLNELKFKKVSEDAAQTALAELVERGEIQDDNSSVVILWRRKFGALPVGEKEKNKQLRFLASRGFSLSAVFSLWKDIEKGNISLEDDD